MMPKNVPVLGEAAEDADDDVATKRQQHAAAEVTLIPFMAPWKVPAPLVN